MSSQREKKILELEEEFGKAMVNSDAEPIGAPPLT
jgi:hypothetical protein